MDVYVQLGGTRFQFPHAHKGGKAVSQSVHYLDTLKKNKENDKPCVIAAFESEPRPQPIPTLSINASVYDTGRATSPQR